MQPAPEVTKARRRIMENPIFVQFTRYFDVIYSAPLSEKEVYEYELMEGGTVDD